MPRNTGHRPARTDSGYGQHSCSAARNRRPTAAWALARRLHQGLPKSIVCRRSGRADQPPGAARQDGRRHRRFRAGGLFCKTPLDCRAVATNLYLRPAQRNVAASRTRQPPACASTSATHTVPGSAGSAKTPTDCFVNICLKALTYRSTVRTSSTLSAPHSQRQTERAGKMNVGKPDVLLDAVHFSLKPPFNGAMRCFMRGESACAKTAQAARRSHDPFLRHVLFRPS